MENDLRLDMALDPNGQSYRCDTTSNLSLFFIYLFIFCILGAIPPLSGAVIWLWPEVPLINQHSHKK